MATPAPAVQPGDVWGQALLDHITSKHTDTLATAATAAQTKADAAQTAAVTAAGTDAQTKATTALNSAKAYADAKPGHLVIGPQDQVPANTPAGTLIGRTAT